VFYFECEILSLTLREEHALRVYENRVLRGIFGPKGEAAIEQWRKPHNEDFRMIYVHHQI
jgi:hypothetical protein